jgi:BASS family bile acid:Na+ symporter
MPQILGKLRCEFNLDMDSSWSDILMVVAIGLISFGIGLNLQFTDFRKVFWYPRAVFSGLVGQLLIVPLVAFLIIYAWPIDPIYKVGFVLVAACPGGITSNLVTFILRGRVPLSVSLTAFNSILILFSIPFWVDWGYRLFLGNRQAINLNVGDTLSEILFSVILPVLAGIVVNELTGENLRQRLEKPLRYIMTSLLVGMVIVVLVFGEDRMIRQLMDNLDLVFPLLILNVSTLFIGFYLTRLLGLDARTRYTIAIEMGLQNSALAIFVANQVLETPEITLVPIIYGAFSLVTTWAIASVFKRLAGKGERSSKNSVRDRIFRG